MNYITDGHDARREASYSDAELAYIARMGGGWKAEIEGGRVPLVGFGALSDEQDAGRLAIRFEDSCQPYHDSRGTTGYKSITFTVPKEVSLFAEGHREIAKEAIYGAVRTALDRAFPGLHYSAVAAIHTRNQSGEIHYHAHVLVGKFARELKSNRLVSLNGKAAGNGPARVSDMKHGWQDGIVKEFRERLQLGIEQRTARSAVSIILPDGQRLEPLNRESRRVLEKQIAPSYTVASPSGESYTKHFRWSAMDDRIFEIASGSKGKSGWDLKAFKELFPDEVKYVSRYEARVKTLKLIGYLTPEEKITPAFRIHFSVHHGVLTPELQRVRLDLQQLMKKEEIAARRKVPLRAEKGNASSPSPFPAHSRSQSVARGVISKTTNVWALLDLSQNMRRRVERLGYSKEEVSRIFEVAQKRKPTRENLNAIRANIERRAAYAPLPWELPQTKKIIRAYVDLQKTKFQRIYLISSGLIKFWKFSDKRALAVRIRRIAVRDLFYAKERRIAQVGRALRPVLWIARVAMPREVRRLELAIYRCARLAQRQAAYREERQEVATAYQNWREQFIKKPIDELKRRSVALGLPTQEEGRERLAKVIQQINPSDVEFTSAVALYNRGLKACMEQASREPAFEKKNLEILKPWSDRTDQLVANVLAKAKEQPSKLTKEEYTAAIRIGRIGHMLTLADECRPYRIPVSHADLKEDIELLSRRIKSFGKENPYTFTNLNSLAPLQVRTQIEAARKAGLLEEGPAWTLKWKEMGAFVKEAWGEINKSRAVEERLEDQLIKKGRAQ